MLQDLYRIMMTIVQMKMFQYLIFHHDKIITDVHETSESAADAGLHEDNVLLNSNNIEACRSFTRRSDS